MPATVLCVQQIGTGNSEGHQVRGVNSEVVYRVPEVIKRATQGWKAQVMEMEEHELS